MKRVFNTTWSYNKQDDLWDLAPTKAFAGDDFTVFREKEGKWNLVIGCYKNPKLIATFCYLENAKRAAILYQELNYFIKIKELCSV